MTHVERIMPNRPIRYISVAVYTLPTDTDISNSVGTIPRFTFTVVDEFRRFLRQFSINFHEILHTLFSIHVVTTLKVSRSFDKYLKS